MSLALRFFVLGLFTLAAFGLATAAPVAAGTYCELPEITDPPRLPTGEVEPLECYGGKPSLAEPIIPRQPLELYGTGDSDGDGLTDADEAKVYGTDPFRADTDGDGFGDGDELFIYCTNPLDAASQPYVRPDGRTLPNCPGLLGEPLLP